MLKIKLSPTGKRNEHHYRIVVMPDRSKLTGEALENLGHYHPLEKQSNLTLDKEKLQAWVKKGAQLTPKVEKLLNRTTK